MDSQWKVEACSDLFCAIKSKEIENVREVLSKNPELAFHPYCRDKDKASPLWRAMLEGHDEIVNMLIQDFRADPDEESEIERTPCSGYTFLQYAASCDYDYYDRDFRFKVLEVSEVLLKLGANVSDGFDLCLQPLQIAASKSNFIFAEFLLKNGVKLPTEAEDCQALLACIFNFKNTRTKNRKDMLMLFLDYGINVGSSDDTDSQNALHYFINAYVRETDDDAVEIAKILIERGGILADDPDQLNWSPLMYSVDKGHLPLVSFFIEKGAYVNRQINDDTGDTPLHSAVELANYEIAELLLSNGADVNAKCFNGFSPLHIACSLSNNEQMINLLLRKGADLSYNNNGVTPFAFFDNIEYDSGCFAMIREFSKLSIKNIPFNMEDMEIIQTNPLAKEYFNKCVNELNQMKNTVFYTPFSYYSVFKMSKKIRKLAHLTKNEEFLLEFEANLSSFKYFQNDLKTIIKEAVYVRDESDAVESRLKCIFGNFFPDIVLRKLVAELALKDLPLD